MYIFHAISGFDKSWDDLLLRGRLTSNMLVDFESRSRILSPWKLDLLLPGITRVLSPKFISAARFPSLVSVISSVLTLVLELLSSISSLLLSLTGKHATSWKRAVILDANILWKCPPQQYDDLDLVVDCMKRILSEYFVSESGWVLPWHWWNFGIWTSHASSLLLSSYD